MNKISIWNMALGFIGTRTVAAEDERTLEAVQCGLYWDTARRQALRDFPYNFAQRRACLAPVDKPDGYEEWVCAYALPQACLSVQAVRQYGTGSGGLRHGGMPFQLSSNDDGNILLLTDARPALLIYTADVQDSSRFDDTFAHMLARKLAALVAIPLLKNNTAKMRELEEAYRQSLAGARLSAAGECREREGADSWLYAR
ncbi:MAG: hypothetical protein PUB01_07025 [Desulfovibrionaceae bacterium]|nr:hypothetical protein [Desulfovibrionaceae bacterium]